MAAENFKVKKGLEVGTAITATSSGVNVTGIVTATQFVGDGSGLTGVTGSGSVSYTHLTLPTKRSV